MASVNNQNVAFGGVLGWWDDDTVAFFNGNDGWIASLYHIPTKTTKRIDESVGGPPGGHVGNHGWAFNGRAAWWGPGGVWSTWGFQAPNAGLLGMCADGAIVWKPDYQSNGPTLYRNLDGSEWKITDGSVDKYATDTSVHGVGRNQLVYEEGCQPHGANLPAITIIPGQQWGSRAALLAGEWWFACYHDKYGIILHPFNSTIGFQVLNGEGWWHLRAMSNTVVRFAISRGIGEQAGDIYCRDYDVAQNLVRDPWGANTWAPVARVDISKIGYVPPSLAFTLDKTSGPAPLTVTANIQQTAMKTWRWLLNDAIHQPIDGNTHTFELASEGQYKIGLRGLSEAGETVTATPQTVNVSAPLAVGEAVVSVDTRGGPVPLTVNATLTQKNLTTWRWLLDGSIHQPNDGLTHQYVIDVPGDHSISVRGSAPAGVITSDPVRITARPKLDFLPGTRCVQAGFGEPIGNDASGAQVCTTLRSKKWDMVRIEATADTVKNQSLVDEARSNNLRPLVLVKDFSYVNLVPDWTDVELLNEPNIAGWTPAAYAAEVLKVVPIAAQRNIRLWVGCISNTSKKDLAWLQAVLALLPENVNVTMHRYPQSAGDTPDKPRSDYATRAEEMAAIKAVVGTRKFGVSEFAYSLEPYYKPLSWWEKIKQFFGWKPPTYQFTESQQASYAKQEFNLWWTAGASFCTWYQVWEDATPDVGLMRLDRTWKPVADIWIL
jgi:hypothetical protein